MKLKHFVSGQKRISRAFLRIVLKLLRQKGKAMAKPIVRLEKKTKKIVGLEVHIALYLLHKILKRQLKIRPRIRLISIVILMLGILYFGSKAAVDYIRPKEADIKINGHAIVLSESANQIETNKVPEVDQVVQPKLSPFEFKKPTVEGILSQSYSAYHRANDIAAPFNSAIHPLGAGVVEFAGAVTDGKGNIVLVDHGDGLKTLYAHMNRIGVGAGNRVNTDSTLGTVGLTGHTTGPHVHLEVYNEGVAIDPASVLPDN